ncbi:MAG: zinc transporter ZupT [Deltaproteobacteria bacterium]|nr:zinc transporter ZupT [Deltaproteobacteria bacterium]
MNSDMLFAFFLTALAGLSTGIGSAIALIARRANKTFLSLGLGFSAGVMIYISFVELLGSARLSLAQHLGAGRGNLLAVAAFFGGMLLIGIIDRLVPSFENPHDAKADDALDAPPANDKLLRMGVLTAIAVGIHNFPEGLATFVSAMSDPKRGVAVAVAIAIHNIPEGIAVSVPLYYATGSRRKAFTWSFLSGLAEPAGALAGYVLLRAFISEAAMGTVHAAVAGIMVFISLDQLIPNAHQYGKGHMPIYGLVGGMVIMAGTLLVLG